VSVIDTDSLKVIGTVGVGKIPWGVAIGKAN
jgi:YVTN family beta-propeller protein